jgi:arylsulfotransferase ASST/Ig-like domain-containing protein
LARALWVAGSVLAALGLARSTCAQADDPLPVTVSKGSSQVADGLIFIAPIGSVIDSVRPRADSTQGPEILDNQGRPVWFLPPPGNRLASDFRVQTYQGQPVLTWVQGPVFEDTQPGATTDYICDSTYRVIATVHAGNGYNADEHEFQLTPQNTALITVFDLVPTDLSSVGGPVNGMVLEGGAQEIDVATGNVLLDWHSLDHVALSESYNPAPTSAGTPYDYFHINSVKLDTDGNILISSRYTKTVFKINRTTGAVIWRLGGKKSDFTLGAGLPFSWQHDAEAVDSSTIRIFDNESDGGAPAMASSRIIWVTHDDTQMTASVSRSIEHPAGLLAPAEGNAQSLPNGDTFVDWGVLGRYSEFDPNGVLLYDAGLFSEYSSYRGYRFPWVGSPATSPSVVAGFNGDGTTTVHAVWNGATEVASWSVMAGNSPASLQPVGNGPWNGLDTAIVVPGQMSYYQVVAANSAGATIGASVALAAPPNITAGPQSQTVADGATVTFSVAAEGPATTYQWAFNGSPISNGTATGTAFSGATSPTLVIGNATAANAGSYTCTASNAATAASSGAATLSVSGTSDVGRLTNISCRANVGTGDNVLIMGFAVGGQQVSGTDTLLVRASGPALGAFGVTGVLPDPELLLSGAIPTESAKNGWGGSSLISGAASAVGAFAWTNPASLDQAIYQAVPTGDFTAEIAGQSGDSGVALAEVYDATPDGAYTQSTPHLTNISARAKVGTGANILIAGFAIGGTTSTTVLIRASGPALLQFGVSGTLPDPELQLLSASTGSPLLASNAGWAGYPEIVAAAASVGAFAWQDAASGDSALIVTLPPGSYTAQVSGVSGDAGVALLEVYVVP